MVFRSVRFVVPFLSLFLLAPLLLSLLLRWVSPLLRQSLLLRLDRGLRSLVYRQWASAFLPNRSRWFLTSVSLLFQCRPTGRLGPVPLELGLSGRRDPVLDDLGASFSGRVG